jgi:hypothetical protein
VLYLREDAELLSKDNLACSKEVAQMLGVHVDKIGRLVAANRLTSVIPTDSSHRIRKYFFLKEEVNRLKAEMADVLSTKALMTESGLSHDVILHMIKAGILRPYSGPSINGQRHYLFHRDAVKEFVRQYSSSDAACFLGVSEGAVRSLARKGMLKAKTGPTVDQSKYYKFRFREVSDFKKYYGDNLGSVVKRRNLLLVDVKVVAKELGIHKSHAWSLINRDFIKPFIRVRHHGNEKKLLFSSNEIQRAKKKLTKGLLSATDAARVLGQDLKAFKHRWVDTGILKPWSRNIGIEKMHFRKEDVRHARLLRRDSVTGPMAAKMLGIHRNRVHCLRKRGLLVPCSGPDVDGFGVYIYRSKDVRRLCRQAITKPSDANKH